MNTADLSKSQPSVSRVKDLAAFFKMRLSAIVVLSAVLGYFMAPGAGSWFDALILISGGLLLTGASNGFNQVWERDLDKLMNRTMHRPLPTQRMSVREGLITASIAGGGGLFLLWYFLNPLSGILGALALFSYVCLYTPLKQRSGLAVFVGAFPGAIPPMLGYVAATGEFGLEPGLLFATQFMWQFPHFWAIAWVVDEDYRRAGYKLLPFEGGRTKQSAFQILLYALFLIPVSILPWAFPAPGPMVGNVALAVVLACGLVFAALAWKLFRTCDTKDAKILMFASFIYLPIVQIFYVIDKL